MLRRKIQFLCKKKQHKFHSINWNKSQLNFKNLSNKQVKQDIFLTTSFHSANIYTSWFKLRLEVKVLKYHNKAYACSCSSMTWNNRYQHFWERAYSHEISSSQLSTYNKLIEFIKRISVFLSMYLKQTFSSFCIPKIHRLPSWPQGIRKVCRWTDIRNFSSPGASSSVPQKAVFPPAAQGMRRRNQGA